jgi:hypothetical protein
MAKARRSLFFQKLEDRLKNERRQDYHGES